MMEKENGGPIKGVTSPGSTPLSENAVKVVVDETTHVLLDGREWEWDGRSINLTTNPAEEQLGPPRAETEAGAEVEDPEAGVEDLVHSPSLDLWHNDYFPPQQDPTSSPNKNSKRPPSPSAALNQPSSKRAKHDHAHDHTASPGGACTTWSVHRGQWRLRVQPRSPSVSSNRDDGNGGNDLEIVMVAVKLEATSGERARNRQRGWLQ